MSERSFSATAGRLMYRNNLSSVRRSSERRHARMRGDMTAESGLEQPGLTKRAKGRDALQWPGCLAYLRAHHRCPPDRRGVMSG